MSYWRDDGSQGGWWITLARRKTSVLLIAVEHVETIRGLEPSLWKPLSLDSPVLPFAAAGDPGYARTMIEVLSQGEFVNLGAWTYSPPRSTRSQFDRDRWGLQTVVGDAASALRQARVFRAMQLQFAALTDEEEEEAEEEQEAEQ